MNYPLDYPLNYPLDYPHLTGAEVVLEGRIRQGGRTKEMSTFHQAGLGPCTGGQKATGGGFQPLKTSSLAREYAIWYASGKGYAASSEVENCRPAGPCIIPHGLCLCEELSPGQTRFSSSNVDVLCASEVHLGRWDPYAHA